MPISPSGDYIYPNILSGAVPQGLPVHISEQGLEAFAEEIYINEPSKKKRRAYSEKSNDPIETIFDITSPPILTPSECQRFLDLQGLVNQGTFKLSSPKTLVGVEVEVENVLYINPNVTLMMWACKEDGSLRNRGKEFVTPGVIPASLAEQSLKHLFACLNPDIDFSVRTSIHVHMDVRQLSLQQIVSLLLTYTTVENLLFKYVGNSRRTNIFCVPLVETGVMDHMAANPKKFVYAIENSWSKYTALNLLPIKNQGSIEFRHMPGTNNVTKIMAWIDMISRLKTFVYRYKYENIVSRILDLNSNSMYKEYVEDIFGDMTGYLDMSNLLIDMEKPVWLAKNCTAANKFHELVLHKPTEESSLGDKLGGWFKKLSREQQEALKYVADEIMGTSDLEGAFHDLLVRHATWIKTHPGHKDKILTAIGKQPKQVQVETVKPKKVDNATYQQEFDQWYEQLSQGTDSSV